MNNFDELKLMKLELKLQECTQQIASLEAKDTARSSAINVLNERAIDLAAKLETLRLRNAITDATQQSKTVIPPGHGEVLRLYQKYTDASNNLGIELYVDDNVIHVRPFAYGTYTIKPTVEIVED
jgi:hypothetical protein